MKTFKFKIWTKVYDPVPWTNNPYILPKQGIVKLKQEDFRRDFVEMVGK